MRRAFCSTLLFPVFLSTLSGYISAQTGKGDISSEPNKPVILAPAPAPEAAPTQAVQQGKPVAGKLGAAARPRIGLALGGGGALGLAHIGVLQWFVEHHIPVDRVAGTSIGALVGSLYATGRTPEQMREVAKTAANEDVFSVKPVGRSLNLRRREDEEEFPNAVTLGLKHGVRMSSGLIDAQRYIELLDALYVSYRYDVDFNALPIPFECVATDLISGEPVVLRKGPLPEAVRASSAIPGAYRPVTVDGKVMVDGSIVENLPTRLLKDDKLDVILAVSLPLGTAAPDTGSTALGSLGRAFSVAIEHNEAESRKLADVLIMPDTNALKNLDITSFANYEQLIQVGYEAAQKHSAELEKYALNDADWDEYEADKQSRARPLPGRVVAIKVDAPDKTATQAAENAVKPEIGKPFDPAKLQNSLDRIRGTGVYYASYLGDTPGTQQHMSSAEAAAPPPDTSLLVRVRSQESGPPFLQLGFGTVGTSSNVTRTEFEARLIQQGLGGFGSELYTIARVGYLTDLSTEYIKTLGGTNYFLAAHAGLFRSPIYIYDNQQRIAERLDQLAGGGVEAGYGIDKFSEIRAGWQEQTLRWNSQVGSDGTPDYSGTTQQVRARYVYDSLDRSAIPRFGYRLRVSAGYLYNTVVTSDTPLAEAAGVAFRTVTPKDLLYFYAMAGSTFGRALPGPLQFTLGGPQGLAASAYEEYRGNEYEFLRTAYLRRIHKLPDILGESVYAFFGYEAGHMLATGGGDVLRQDGVLGIAAGTPLGVISMGTSVGDAGRRKILFTVGQTF